MVCIFTFNLINQMSQLAALSRLPGRASHSATIGLQKALRAAGQQHFMHVVSEMSPFMHMVSEMSQFSFPSGA